MITSKKKSHLLIVFVSTCIGFLLMGGGTGFYNIRSISLKLLCDQTTIASIVGFEQKANLRQMKNDFVLVQFNDLSNHTIKTKAFVNISQYNELKSKMNVNVQLKYLSKHPSVAVIQEDGSEKVCIIFVFILLIILTITYLVDLNDYKRSIMNQGRK